MSYPYDILGKSALCCLFPLFTLSSTHAAPDTVDTDFKNTAGSVYRDAEDDFGSVASILVQPDGKILVGSNEMATTLVEDGDLFAPLIRFNPDGTVDNTFFADDHPSGSGEGIYYDSTGWPEVMALGLQSDGKIIAGGVMQGMRDGTNSKASRSLIRINPDGSVDPTFQTYGTEPWISGNINYVNHLFVEPDDKIVIAGGFRGLRNAITDPLIIRHGVARLNADGSVDETFEFHPTDFGVSAGLLGSVRLIIYQAERDLAGNYYVVGEISGVGSNIQVFARLFPDGRRDFSFTPNLPEARWNSVAIDRQGRITVTGLVNFFPTVMHRVFPDGSIDPSFIAPGGLFGAMAQPLEIDSAGRFLYTSSSLLRRVNADGTNDPTFTGTAGWEVWATVPSWNVATTAPDGRIYAGGFFNRVNGQASVKLVRFEGNPVANSFLPDATTVSVLENSGMFHYSITRLGDGIGAASIDFATLNGTALAGTDFTATSGTLAWADGETGPKYFPVTLIDNATQDGDKSFTVEFTNPTGGTLDGPASATITIVDDEAEPVITTDPVSLTVKQGASATFSVTISSPVPVTFQWFKNGDPMPGKTGISLTLANIAESDEAEYTVSVTGAGDPVTSLPATLTVTAAETVLDGTYNPALENNLNPVVYLPDGGILELSGWYNVGYTVRRFNPDGSLHSTWPLINANANSGSLSIIPLPDGKFLATGAFTEINGLTRHRLARFNADGTIDPDFDMGLTNIAAFSGPVVTASGAVYISYRPSSGSAGLRRLLEDGSIDPGFTSNVSAGTSGSLRALIELPDGSILVSHVSSGAGNPPSGLARLNPDGSPVDGFVPAGMSPVPSHLLLLDDGRIAMARGSILEIRFADGTIDTSFALAGTFTGTISGLHLQRGRLVVTGATAYNGEAIPGLARFSLTGDFDDNFPGVGGPNSGFNTHVSSATVLSDDTLLVRGGFTSWNGISRPGIARLLLTGVEAGFAETRRTVFENAPPFTVDILRYGDASSAASVRVTSSDGTATAPDNYLAIDEIVSWAAGDTAPKTVTITPVDDALVNGDRTFTLTLSEGAGLVGIPTPFTVTLRDDESLPQITSQPENVGVPLGFAASFSVAASSPTSMTYQWFKDGVLISGATAATYQIASAAEANEGVYTVRITNDYGTVLSAPATLAIVPPPAAIAEVFSNNPSFGNNVLALANAPDGGVYVGGQFTNYNSTGRNYLVKINENGTLDTDFNPPVFGSTVRGITVQPDGKLIIVGDFSQVAGINRRGVARLEASGALDANFTTNVGAGTNGTAYAAAVLPDGRIAIGGDFTSWNGVTLNPNRDLIRLNADGTLDAAYLKTSATARIVALKALPDGNLLASHNTTSSSAVKVTRFLPDLTADPAFVYGNLQTRVDAIDLAANGDYLFAGPGGIHRVAPDLSSSTQILSGTYFAVAGQRNGRIVFGGSTVPRLFRRLADGSVDPTFVFSANPNGNVNAIALRDDGKIWVGGGFTTINGRTVNRLVLLNGDAVDLAITSQPAPLTIVEPGETVTLSVTTTGTTTISYQWFRNGEPIADGPGISGATTGTLILTDAQTANNGSYHVVASNESGSEPSDTAVVIVLDAPVVLADPESVAVFEGFPVTLAAEVLGAAPLAFEWWRDGVLVENGPGISGADTATLSLANASLEDAGNYTLIISNSLGTAYTTPATVTVSENPAAVAPGFTGLTFSSGNVRVILPLPDGRALIGGDFGSASDGVHTSGARLAVVNPDGSLDPIAGLSADATIYGMRAASDGKILLTGEFNTVNGETRRRLARLNADLSLDDTFDASYGFHDIFSGRAWNVAEEASGSLLLVGEFGNFDGQPGTARAVRLTSTGAHDPSFTSTANQVVNFVHAEPDGSLIFGGYFSNWGGRDYLIRTLADGTVHPTITYDIAGGAFFATRSIRLGDGGILVNFDFGGTRRYAADGTRDNTFLATGNPGAPALADDSEGRIYLGGNFTSKLLDNNPKLIHITKNHDCILVFKVQHPRTSSRGFGTSPS